MKVGLAIAVLTALGAAASAEEMPPSALPANAGFPTATVGFPATSLRNPNEQDADNGGELLRWVLNGDVLFDFDKSDARPDAEKELKAFLGELSTLEGDFTLHIEGHTDSKGSDTYNDDLSVRRADSIAKWLAAADPSLPQAATTGFGERRPVAENALPDGTDNPVGRLLNRRVEIVVRSAS